MILCLKFCKSEKQKGLEKTYYRAVNELSKSLDIVNVIKTAQEIRLLKEIIFEKHQKELFDHLTNPIIIGDKVIIPYRNEWLEEKALIKITGDKNIILKALLNDSFIQLSNAYFYNMIEKNLIKELYLIPVVKDGLFRTSEKELVKKKTITEIIEDPGNMVHLKKLTEDMT